MNFQLSDKSVRAMAARLRTAVGAKEVTHSGSLEVLSKALGFENWDRLSGMLKQTAPAPAVSPSFCLSTPVTLYIGAFSTSEFGASPPWAKVIVDQAFVTKLLSLQNLCIRESLHKVATGHQPEFWYEPQKDDAEIEWLNVQDDGLYVSRASFWFRGLPKHCDYGVETRMLDIETLVAALNTRTGDDYLAWHKDVLVYVTSGDQAPFLEELVECGELDESYLPPDNL